MENAECRTQNDTLRQISSETSLGEGRFVVTARGGRRLREIASRFPWARPRAELRSATQPPLHRRLKIIVSKNSPAAETANAGGI